MSKVKVEVKVKMKRANQRCENNIFKITGVGI